MFTNPLRDFAICDVCVCALVPLVQGAYANHENQNPYATPPGATKQ